MSLGGEELVASMRNIVKIVAHNESSNRLSSIVAQSANGNEPSNADGDAFSESLIKTTQSTPATVEGERELPAPPPITDTSLENAVFTYGAIAPRDPAANHETNYDRMEFLGDAYIQVLSTNFVWSFFPRVSPGRMSQIREILVNNQTLGQFSEGYGFEKRMRIPTEYIQQPKLWRKIKGDVFEAYVGAVILSNPIDGYELVQDWLTELWMPKVAGISKQPEPRVHYKQDLSQRIAGVGIKIAYVDERPSVRHPRGIQTFYIGVYLTGWGYVNQHLGSGQGLNKVIAGNNAAKQALDNHPLIDEIAATKQEYDAKVRAERAQAELKQMNENRSMSP